MSEVQAINLNDHVRVTLTEFGVSVYNDYLVKLNQPPSDYMPGKTLEIPLWEMASIFGGVLFNGAVKHPFASYTLEYRPII
jgi:hypothetical protein